MQRSCFPFCSLHALGSVQQLLMGFGLTLQRALGTVASSEALLRLARTAYVVVCRRGRANGLLHMLQYFLSSMVHLHHSCPPPHVRSSCSEALARTGLDR